jgi:hypothetical protein
MSENENIDGTPAARLLYLMVELDKRFPHPRPCDSSTIPELHYLQAIDQAIADSKELAAAKRQMLNLFSGVHNVFTKER